ncbi:MAG: selenocysteine-specific translation elongation factor, partial [Candidatus Dormibacteria bacterium]
MQVIATAGHVDHGKSTLIRALTGMEPDRWAEERRRGMTIDLGYAWMTLPSGTQAAFVDVPGHERFTTNMLAGVGPVPAVLLVIAADAGWATQTEEHVCALDALGVREGLVAVTRCDLADPAPVAEEARRRLSRTCLAGLSATAVSGVTGEGLPRLVQALDELAQRLPDSAPDARVRMWVDRSFTIRGAGTVVTGTLPAGTLRRGDALELHGSRVTVRGLHCLGLPVDEVRGPARVAVNLRGIEPAEVSRGAALLTPGAWHSTAVLDGRADREALPSHVVLHVGSAAIPASVRPLSPPPRADAGAGGGAVRLTLATELPLQVGDRLLLRDPGRRQLLGGVTVVDPMPPVLRRRGAARTRATALAGDAGVPSLAAELHRRGAVSERQLAALGVPLPAPMPPQVVAAAGWLCTDALWTIWRRALAAAVDTAPRGSLIDDGSASADLVRSLQLPDPALLGALLPGCPELEEVRGRVRRRGSGPTLRADLRAAVARLSDSLQAHP